MSAMKRLDWMVILTFLPAIGCGTHVGNGFWGGEPDRKDDKVANEEAQAPEEGQFEDKVKDGEAPTSAGAETAAPSAESPWFGLSAPLDPFFAENIPFSADLIGFLGTSEGICFELDETGSSKKEVLAFSRENGQVLLKNGVFVVGEISADTGGFSYAENIESETFSEIQIKERPSEVLTLGVKNHYYLKTNTQEYDLTWTLTTEETIEFQMDVVTKDMPNVQTITRYVLEKQSEPLAVPDL
jgi:hypothetical protein